MSERVEPLTAAEYRGLIGGTPMTPIGSRTIAALEERIAAGDEGTSPPPRSETMGETTITLRCRVCGREEVAPRYRGAPANAVVEERTCGLHFSATAPGEYAAGDCSVRFLDADGRAITPEKGE